MTSHNIVGANPGELRNLAAQFNAGADQIVGEINAINGRLARTPWSGGAADQFRNRWRTADSRQLAALADTLRDAANSLRRNADEQERASSGSSARSIWGNFARLGLLGGAAQFLRGQGDTRFWFDLYRTDKGHVETIKNLLKPKAIPKTKIGPTAPLFLAVDGSKFVGDYGDWIRNGGSPDKMIRSGIDTAWGVASVNPYVAAGKGAWDAGYMIGTELEHVLQDKFQHEDKILNNATVKNYGTTELSPSQAAEMSKRYDGVSGFGRFVKDLF